MSNVIQTYWTRVKQFSPNARLYLASIILTGAALGIYRLLFNFYVLSLNMDANVVGQLTSTNSMTALILAVPMGYLADMLGARKPSSSAVWRSACRSPGWCSGRSKAFYSRMSILSGAAQSLSAVTMSPFLLENSGAEERTYLFSLASGAQMTASFVGNSIGGNLPTWIAVRQGLCPTSSAAYAGALAIVAVVALAGLAPFFFMKMPRLEEI